MKVSPFVVVRLSASAINLRMLAKHGPESYRSGCCLRVPPNCYTSNRSWCNHKLPSDLLQPSLAPDEDKADRVSMDYVQGLPRFTVPLPSRNEKCEFTLKPITHKVGDFIQMLKLEDRGIDRAMIFNEKGIRVSATCSIDSILNNKFILEINDRKYEVQPPARQKPNINELQQLGDIRRIVAQLYEALNVGEFHVKKTVDLNRQLEDLRYELEPLEQKRAELSARATRRTTIMTWGGLLLMSVQFGVLARLTWWEYSWDIMEPVTYFVTYGTTMAMYAYYCMTKQEYNMPDVKNREYLLKFYKDARKFHFDVEKYNLLKNKVAELEYDLKRLRDPLNMQLPPHLLRSEKTPHLTFGAFADPATPPAAADTAVDKLKGLAAKLPFVGSHKEKSK